MQTRLEPAVRPATEPGQSPESFLRLPQVLARVPVSKSTLWGWVRDGKFPKPVKLGPMTTAWHSKDVAAWMAKASEGQP